MTSIYIFKFKFFAVLCTLTNLQSILHTWQICMYVAPLCQWISALIWNMCRSAGSGDLSSAKCNTRTTFSSVQSGPVQLSLVELSWVQESRSPVVPPDPLSPCPTVPLSLSARAWGCASSCLLSSSKQAARQLSRSVATVLAATLNWLKRCRRRRSSSNASLRFGVLINCILLGALQLRRRTGH